MIVGSGLLAHAFFHTFSKREDVCIYAAGVSNSNCISNREFVRERQRLVEALAQAMHVDAFIYFGTCSVYDPEVRDTPYVKHKLDMEKLVSDHPRNLIIRLPQVAGKTPNPHTLLNFLYSRISLSERFALWAKAKRNIIDVADVAIIVCQLIADKTLRNTMFNVANTSNYKMLDIVGAMERVLGKKALYDVLDQGSEYHIDTSGILPVLKEVGGKFDDDYLGRVIRYYYSGDCLRGLNRLG